MKLYTIEKYGKEYKDIKLLTGYRSAVVLSMFKSYEILGWNVFMGRETFFEVNVTILFRTFALSFGQIV